MNEPNWLEKNELLASHAELLAWFGGLSGLRDEGLLDSALHSPRQRWCYESPSLVELATAYASAVVRNYPFVDGNKRAGFMAAYTFLGANGLELTAPEVEVVERTLALAASAIEESDYAAFLAEYTAPVEDEAK